MYYSELLEGIKIVFLLFIEHFALALTYAAKLALPVMSAEETDAAFH